MLGRIIVRCRFFYQNDFITKTEVTLDRIVLPATKGHFCSILVSNIFPDPLFHLAAFCLSFTTLKHKFF